MAQSVSRQLWKPVNTGENEAQPEETEFDLELLDEEQLAAFTLARCLNEARRHDPRTDQQIARAVGASKGYMSKWLNSVGAEQLDRFARYCQQTGHIGPIQKVVYDLGFDLTKRRKRPRRPPLQAPRRKHND